MLVQIQHRDIGALVGEQNRDAAPDTRIAPGHDGDLTFQFPAAL